jgi:hypothetical protein
MPYNISWYIPDRVIHEEFYGTVNLEEVEQIQHIFAAYLDLGKAPVHVLVDMTRLEEYPKSVSQLKSAMVMMNNQNLGWVVIINQNPVLKFLTSVMTQLTVSNVRFRLFDTLEDGLEFLKERDSTLQIKSHQ